MRQVCIDADDAAALLSAAQGEWDLIQMNGGEDFRPRGVIDALSVALARLDRELCCEEGHTSCFECRDYGCGCTHEADCACDHTYTDRSSEPSGHCAGCGRCMGAPGCSQDRGLGCDGRFTLHTIECPVGAEG